MLFVRNFIKGAAICAAFMGVLIASFFGMDYISNLVDAQFGRGWGSPAVLVLLVVIGGFTFAAVLSSVSRK